MVNDRMNSIYNIISKNKKTFRLKNGKIDKKLNELEKIKKLQKRDFKGDNEIKIDFINPNEFVFKKKTHKVNNVKRSLNSTITDDDEKIQLKSELVSHLCPVGNIYVVSAYLSDETAEIVKNLPNVEIFEKSCTSTENKVESYFNKQDILDETHWRGIEVQENDFDFDLKFTHLSLLSQGKFYGNSTTTYDNNFYYPSSAGKGIDIYAIEKGINIYKSKEDFDTYNGERSITCDIIIDEKEYKHVKSIKNCEDRSNNHGTVVAIAAVGKLHGVAKKANYHLIKASTYDTDDDLLALKYIQNNAIPGKSIINISHGCYDCYRKTVEVQISNMIKDGFIIFVAAGNDKRYACENFHFNSYPGIISIGAINNDDVAVYGDMELMYENTYSNYGECVDFFAPGTVRVIDPITKNEKFMDHGTSFASPIVAGLAATIMSDDFNTKYIYENIKQKLNDLSIKNVISNLNEDTPNRLVNNGKLSVLQPPRCDDPSGNYHCQNDGCCTKFGQCIDYKDKDSRVKDLCSVEYQCSEEFGYCYSEKDHTDCLKELRPFEICEISTNSLIGKSIDDITDVCELYNKVN